MSEIDEEAQELLEELATDLDMSKRSIVSRLVKNCHRSGPMGRLFFLGQVTPAMVKNRQHRAAVVRDLGLK